MNKPCKHLLNLAIVLAAFGAKAQDMDGYAIYNQNNSNTCYLIDSEGDIAHIWSCPTAANYASALKDNGNLVRGAQASNAPIDGPATGGLIQELDPDANVVWEFEYSTETVITHHDIALMPNGNVLMIAWEEISEEDMVSWGYEGDDDVHATHIIEVQQDGTGGEIVWEWHVIDHLVQDVDDTKPNYGDISDNWQLLDINVPAGTGGGPGGGNGPLDWLHVNGIDYNETLDQIVFTSRYLSEVFVIDHSTTTDEAATHEGGNSGMGGDFLYRWGNPGNYDTPGTQVIPAAVHDSRWIKEGRPNAGWIQIFNNEGNNGQSTIDAINAPHNGYVFDKVEGEQFEPASYSWRHECIDDASGQSASDRMTNGNVFVNLSGGFGGGGYMYEATEDGTIVFQYNADSEKAFRYECDHPGIQALLENPCDDGTGISEIKELNVTVFPNPSGDGQFKVVGEFGLNGLDQILVHDMYGNLVADLYNTNRIDLSEAANGVYVATLIFEGKRNSRKLTIAQ